MIMLKEILDFHVFISSFLKKCPGQTAGAFYFIISVKKELARSSYAYLLITLDTLGRICIFRDTRPS